MNSLVTAIKIVTFISILLLFGKCSDSDPVPLIVGIWTRTSIDFKNTAQLFEGYKMYGNHTDAEAQAYVSQWTDFYREGLSGRLEIKKDSTYSLNGLATSNDRWRFDGQTLILYRSVGLDSGIGHGQRYSVKSLTTSNLVLETGYFISFSEYLMADLSFTK